MVIFSHLGQRRCGWVGVYEADACGWLAAPHLNCGRGDIKTGDRCGRRLKKLS